MIAVSLIRRLGRGTGRARPRRRHPGGELPRPDRLLPGSGSPLPGDAIRLAVFLRDHPCWSVFWDKRHYVWRAAEDDPGSALYAECADVDAVISYITAHT
jgi:hypothetical protein